MTNVITLPRSIQGPLLGAARAQNPWGKAKGSNPAAKVGLRYERKGQKALDAAFPAARREHNPWFEFHDRQGRSLVSPDSIIWIGDEALVVEFKLTWVPSAIVKLEELYLPVISRALGGVHCIPLVIARNLTRESPRAQLTLSAALTAAEPLYQWLEHTKMRV